MKEWWKQANTAAERIIMDSCSWKNDDFEEIMRENK